MNKSTTRRHEKPITLSIQNMSVLPESFRSVFPEEGYLFMKPIEGAYEVWQYSYGSDSGIFREKVSEDVGISMIKQVRKWNRVATDLNKQILERGRRERQVLLGVINELPAKIAGFNRVNDELCDDEGKVVFRIKEEDLKLESFEKLEEKVYVVVFGIDKIDF